MINLKELINEGTKNVKLLVRNRTNTDELVQFSVYTTNDLFIFLPKSSKMLDILEEVDESVIAKSIEMYLKKRTNLVFDYNPTYIGAGYGFTLNFDKILTKL